MTIWSEVPRDPPPRLLRQFAGLCVLAAAGMAAWQLWGRHRPGVALGLAVLATMSGLFGLLRPTALRPVFVGWMLAAAPVGWVVSTLALGIIYFAVIAPLGLVFRLAGRDALALRRRPGATTYWTPHADPDDPARYLRQY